MVLGYSCKKHLVFGCILALNNSLWASVNHAQSTESSGGQSHIEKYWSICSIRPAFNNQISTDRPTLERYAYHRTLLKQNLWNFFIKGCYKRSLFYILISTCYWTNIVLHFIYEYMYFAYITGSFLSILETSGIFALEFTDTLYIFF